MVAEVGLGLGLDVGLEPGRGGQIPSDLPNKGQIRVEREKERKQSHLERYFKPVNPSTGTPLAAPAVASVFVIRSRPNEQAIIQVSNASTHSKKRTASGDLLQKATKTQILLSKEPHKAANNRVDKLEDTEADRL